MKKLNILLSVTLMLFLFAGTYSMVSALEIDNEDSVTINTNKGLDASVSSSTNANVGSSSQKDKNNEEDVNKQDDSSTSTDVKKEDNNKNDEAEVSLEADAHRSTVSTFVKSLLDVADREKGKKSGIGEEVKVIAQEQNDSSETTVTAMEKVEARKGVKAFLVGTDYKNIGVIRSELAKTSNQIERLKEIISKTTNAADKAVLEAQVKVLEDNQVKVDAFVKSHEDKFSLFGWFVKIFVK